MKILNERHIIMEYTKQIPPGFNVEIYPEITQWTTFESEKKRLLNIYCIEYFNPYNSSRTPILKYKERNILFIELENPEKDKDEIIRFCKEVLNRIYVHILDTNIETSQWMKFNEEFYNKRWDNFHPIELRHYNQ